MFSMAEKELEASAPPKLKEVIEEVFGKNDKDLGKPESTYKIVFDSLFLFLFHYPQ